MDIKLDKLRKESTGSGRDGLGDIGGSEVRRYVTDPLGQTGRRAHAEA